MTGDTYNSKVENSSEVAVAQGRAKASIKSRDRTSVAGAGLDLKTLAGELTQLRVAMRAEAQEVEHDEAVAAVGKAQKAAETGEAETVMENLKAAGKWALGFAEKLTLGVATKAIEQAIKS